MENRDPGKPSGAVPAENMAEALVSRENLRHNARLILDKLQGRARIMGIVKANAYGHGARKVSASLESLGIRDFGVANVHEAIELKTGGTLKNSSSILAFSSPLFSQIESYLLHDIDMT
ncbi:MAG: alanine racemase, partial [Chlorobiaceae bacterium]|nr:alanine racemase [Chlorobiaceae bacterium]